MAFKDALLQLSSYPESTPAVADALPILERAKTVRVVTITQEKTIETKRSGADLA